MNFSVIGEHRDFFRKHHWIECEGVLSASQQAVLSREMATVLAARLKLPISKASANQLFASGHDLWRGAAPLKKIILQKGLAEIAAELLEEKPLRFGYDQLFPPLASVSMGADAYGAFLKQTLSLREISSIQGIVCGAMLCVVAPTINEVIDEEVKIVDAPLESGLMSSQLSSQPVPISSVPIFSTTAGNGIFFSPDTPISFEGLRSHSGGTYLLLVYTKPNAVYYRQDLDPHLHDFRNLGYNFGDRLLDRLNPLVYH